MGKPSCPLGESLEELWQAASRDQGCLGLFQAFSD